MNDPLASAATGDTYFHGANSPEERHRAATLVGRFTNQHACSAPAGQVCVHPDHRRDVDYTRVMLDLLGLSDVVEEKESEGIKC